MEAKACTDVYDEAIGRNAAQVLADLSAAPASYDAACGLGKASVAIGDLAGAEEAFRAAIDQAARGSRDRREALLELARVELYRGDKIAATTTFQTAYSEARSGADEVSAYQALIGLTAVRLSDGNVEGAEAFAREAVQRINNFQKNGGTARAVDIAKAYFNLGSALYKLEAQGEARDALEAGLVAAREDGNAFVLTNYSSLLYAVSREAGDADGARAYLDQTVADLGALPPGPARLTVLVNVGYTALRDGDAAAAAIAEDRLEAEMRAVPDLSAEYDRYLAVLRVGQRLLAREPEAAFDAMSEALAASGEHYAAARGERLAEMEAAFDAERREAEIASLTEREALARRLVRFQRFALGAIALLGAGFVALACVVFHRRRLAAKAAEEASALRATLAERSRLSREVHDTLMQSYAATTMQAQRALRMMDERADEAREVLESALATSDDAMREAREAILGTYTAPGDIGAALNELPARHADANAAITVEVDADLPALPDEARATVLRVASEAVSNAVRHADADEVAVTLRRTDHGVRLSVRDDGDGFDPDAPAADGHAGLAVMRERAAALGSELRIGSTSGAGTEVELDLPCENASRHDGEPVTETLR